MMANDKTEKKPRPMPDAGFKCMIWCFRLVDLIQDPQRRLDNVPLKAGMTVADYGCGPGRFTVPVGKLVGPQGRVFAIDIHPVAIEVIRKKAIQENLPNIEAVLVDSYDTGIESSTIDLVLLLDTLHLVGDPDSLFREIHRILKPDGTLYMDPGHMKLLRATEIVESTGLFTIAEYWDKDMLVAPVASL